MASFNLSMKENNITLLSSCSGAPSTMYPEYGKIVLIYYGYERTRNNKLDASAA